MLAYELCHELGFNACTFALEPGSRHGELSPLSVIIIHRGETHAVKSLEELKFKLNYVAT